MLVAVELVSAGYSAERIGPGAVAAEGCEPIETRLLWLGSII